MEHERCMCLGSVVAACCLAGQWQATIMALALWCLEMLRLALLMLTTLPAE